MIGSSCHDRLVLDGFTGLSLTAWFAMISQTRGATESLIRGKTGKDDFAV
jgi:hypothetical protein